jgi:selenocysteine lyase/cysteine desulfurase
VGLAAALQLIQDLGPAKIETHVRALTDQLIAGLDALHLEVVTPRESERRSGIITFSAGSAEKNVAWMNCLLEKKILVSVRYTSDVGGIRVSCHLYNTPEDIDRLLSEVKHLSS